MEELIPLKSIIKQHDKDLERYFIYISKHDSREWENYEYVVLHVNGCSLSKHHPESYFPMQSHEQWKLHVNQNKKSKKRNKQRFRNNLAAQLYYHGILNKQGFIDIEKLAEMFSCSIMSIYNILSSEDPTSMDADDLFILKEEGFDMNALFETKDNVQNPLPWDKTLAIKLNKLFANNSFDQVKKFFSQLERLRDESGGSENLFEIIEILSVLGKSEDQLDVLRTIFNEVKSSRSINPDKVLDIILKYKEDKRFRSFIDEQL
ncbi:hypothetical protein QUF84_14965 [Fictibacillus enclensis]|uniref:hypothetical protein n=1 Tax=Fictibacillus enclensis TaxID=1017270 RepID=UPI0025A02988|nr:hypothetical protein [Fictibacillus enclensis]MDM5338511.1 hypothetical protein [Fictibacillus enclensis]